MDMMTVNAPKTIITPPRREPTATHGQSPSLIVEEAANDHWISQPLHVPDLTESMKIPMTQQDADDVDKALAEELLKLSMTDYDKLNFEVHGLAQVDDDESEVFVQTCFGQLQAELDTQLCSKRRNKVSVEAYRQVSTVYPDYVHDPTFRLRFLRSERFDIKLTAEKIIKHFHSKCQLFGEGDVLGRDVTLADLSTADMNVLSSAFLQVLPIRDTAGRFVLVVRPHVCWGESTVNLSRVWFYIFQSMTRKEECQKRGIVIVTYMVGGPVGFGGKELSKRRATASRISDANPIKVAAVHLCYNNKNLRPWMAAHVLYFLTKRHRSRLRHHHGDYAEAVFKLQTYGIPINAEHLQDGEASVAIKQDWLTAQRFAEGQKTLLNINVSTQNNIANVADDDDDDDDETEEHRRIVPGCNDVLFGKGKKVKEHEGNIRLEKLIQSYEIEYENAGKFAKTDIAERIIRTVHEEYEGCFLKLNPTAGYWEEVERKAAREKVAHYFRHIRKKKNRQIITSDDAPSSLYASSFVDQKKRTPSLTSSSHLFCPPDNSLNNHEQQTHSSFKKSRTTEHHNSSNNNNFKRTVHSRFWVDSIQFIPN